MPMITRTNYPPGVAVFDAKNHTPEQLARIIGSLLFDFNFSAAVILRGSDTIRTTQETLLNRINEGKRTKYYKVPPNNAKNQEALDNTLNHIKADYGADFCFQATVASYLGASRFTLYTDGTQTKCIHLDPAEKQSMYTRDYQGQLSRITTGITCTMSPQIGTDLIMLSTNQVQKSKNNPDMWELTNDMLGRKAPDSQDEIWHTPRNSLVFMHSKEVQNTYPCAHRTPELNQNQHRTVGVALICGMN